MSLKEKAIYQMGSHAWKLWTLYIYGLTLPPQNMQLAQIVKLNIEFSEIFLNLSWRKVITFASMKKLKQMEVNFLTNK